MPVRNTELAKEIEEDKTKLSKAIVKALRVHDSGLSIEMLGDQLATLYRNERLIMEREGQREPKRQRKQTPLTSSQVR